ncbi:biotin-dependent carboxyltransferase family protein [Marinifilum caeruleilacunae]|uniref:Biotin-dependent carboxyltransferase family protein n=1 Tax=Marinifilum caeruleilacunae TaxID=2499076 RepID=A0ABX1WS38_9BACT|nr:biotin-dependent carboxyltransferase family protein [Marinifilum caeruleilacunae]NOU58816.1 biotin-dependent carboxyltransferase family protein [Marinifilum caeruleilacunae]
MGKIKILNPGLLSTIQDGGRFGYQQYGMPVAGAMDLHSLQLANWCVRNPAHEACIEATILGPTIEFQSDTYIAISGATIQPFVNEQAINMNAGIKVRAGDVLSFGSIQTGCRIYIAIAGGFDIPELMESKSTYLRGNLGGFEGRALKAGDELEIADYERRLKGVVPEELIPNYSNFTEIRITSGAEIKRFTMDGVKTFLCSVYSISPQSDRMGYRLSGQKIEHANGADIISSGIVTGAIQVPGHGEPIIMMSDHQTVGGYTKIAQVISVDLPLLGQMKPGDQIKFKEVNLDQAQQLLLERNQWLKQHGIE